MSSQNDNFINLQVGGEIGKYNTLPVDYLVAIAKNLQVLLQTLAKVNVSDTSTIDLNNFKIELIGFKTGSAVPQFQFTPRTHLTIDGDIDQQRQLVRHKFDELIEASGMGDFTKVRELYPGERRNEVVDNLYEFVNSFGDSPVTIVDIDGKDGKVTPLYSSRPFGQKVRDDLKVSIIKSTEFEKKQEISYQRVQKTTYPEKKGSKIKVKVLEEYTDTQASFSFAPEIINTQTATYELIGPLRCLLEKEDDYYVLTNELLDIVGTGLTTEETEKSFADEFDFIYQRYNSLDDSKLTKRLVSVKMLLKAIVKHVTTHAHA
jgi:hypothetical protein